MTTTWKAWSQLSADGKVDVEGETMADAARAYAEASKGRNIGIGRIVPSDWQTEDECFLVTAAGAVFNGDTQIL